MSSQDDSTSCDDIENGTIKWPLYYNRSYPDQEQLDKVISKVGIAKLVTC